MPGNTNGIGASAPARSANLAEIAKDFLPDGKLACALLELSLPCNSEAEHLLLRRICERSTLIVLLVDQKPCERALRREPFLRHRRPGGRILVVSITADGLEPWVDLVRRSCKPGTDFFLSTSDGYEFISPAFNATPPHPRLGA